MTDEQTQREGRLDKMLSEVTDRVELERWTELIWDRKMELDVENLGEAEFIRRLTAPAKDARQDAALAILKHARFASDEDRTKVMDAVAVLMGNSK